ncbi:TPA: diguanylate cyclase [Burkholderia contaminans]|uniref:diguanylate cyclase n=2 Tax=Burkholderia contaminans TaxID=488447 RepID=A0AAP4R219_9BURK|nr:MULTISPECIES: sensor domain-containing diguanylate cyclase [Burkholderia]MBD1410691.1 diguanylate cyclase [Burkholderia contaminans]MBH9669393.1 diguanylate cyclase [Burkholderia contaminans]MBH9676377.1 diguanylate cyclase [Burkholderia contaminans]MBH9706801.1 diguanylate cyclase [Burkholderia contaminans]MBM6425925.1 diguanylate cyclase [Burkholderia contaminans]
MAATTSIEKIADWAGRNHLVVGALGTLMSLAALGISAATLWIGRSEVIDHAHETSRNVAAVLVSQIARTVETSNNALVALASDLGKPAVRRMDAGLRHDLLFERTAAQYVTGMGVTDRHGQLIDGCCGTTHRWDFSDRDYFKVHRDADNVGLYVSEAYRARSRGGKESIALSRRIERPDHTFNGIAVVALDIAYFEQLLSGLDVGPNGVSAILREDGSILARNPSLNDNQMNHLRRSKAFDRMVHSESGFYPARSVIDGTMRLYTYQRVPGTPLIAVVAPAERDVLASITRLSWTVGVSATVISALFCTVVWLLAFALRDNLRKQTLLMDLTRTDPLTGLCNRRALDIALGDEWERLQRGSNGSLSILFIDADHFKQYNDRHGHAVGDTALRFLAECIRAHTRRRGDLAARYGGEEFVAVLPDTDESGAAQVAEAIRREVERNRLDGFAETVPAFTVSIGCATGHRARPPSVRALSHQADMALYRAKREGRNRVCCAETEQLARLA